MRSWRGVDLNSPNSSARRRAENSLEEIFALWISAAAVLALLERRPISGAIRASECLIGNRYLALVAGHTHITNIETPRSIFKQRAVPGSTRLPIMLRLIHLLASAARSALRISCNAFYEQCHNHNKTMSKPHRFLPTTLITPVRHPIVLM